MLNKLFEKKEDVDLESKWFAKLENIAKNVVDLLLELGKDESFLKFFEDFLDDQPDQVKIVLMKTFYEN